MPECELLNQTYFSEFHDADYFAISVIKSNFEKWDFVLYFYQY